MSEITATEILLKQNGCKTRVRELAEAHWGYIEKLLYVSGVQDQEIERIGFHYKTAMIHGYGHGWENAKNERT